MQATEGGFLLPVYSEVRACRFLEMGWKLVSINQQESGGIPEYILGWFRPLPAPSPDGGHFEIENGRWRFREKTSAVA